MKCETITVRACIFLQTYGLQWSRDERTRMKISFCKNYGLTCIAMEEEPGVHLQEHFLVHLHATELVQPSPHMQVSAQTRSTNLKWRNTKQFMHSISGNYTISSHIKPFFFLVHKVINHSLDTVYALHHQQPFGYTTQLKENNLSVKRLSVFHFRCQCDIKIWPTSPRTVQERTVWMCTAVLFLPHPEAQRLCHILSGSHKQQFQS